MLYCNWCSFYVDSTVSVRLLSCGHYVCAICLKNFAVQSSVFCNICNQVSVSFNSGHFSDLLFLILAFASLFLSYRVDMNNGTLNNGHLIICHPGHGHDLIIQNDFSVHDDLRKKFEDMNLLMVSVIIIRMHSGLYGRASIIRV